MTAGSTRDGYFRRIVEGTIGAGPDRVPAVKLALKPESLDSIGAPRNMALHPKPLTDAYSRTPPLSNGDFREGNRQSASKDDHQPADAKSAKAEPPRRQVVARDDKSTLSSLDSKLPESDGIPEKDVNVNSAHVKPQERGFAIPKSPNKTGINSQRDQPETKHDLDSIKSDSPKDSAGVMNEGERTEFAPLDKGDRSRRDAFDGRKDDNDAASNSQAAAPALAGAPPSVPSKGAEETIVRVDSDDKITGGRLPAALPPSAVRNLRRDEDSFLQQSTHARLAQQGDGEAKSASADSISATSVRPTYVEYKKRDVREKASETIVTVNIGRIEIRAPAQPKPSEHPVSPPAFSPPLSLAEYLRRRNAKK
ncbi:hypothetical protein NTE_00498 [Candidatus Nitrososphaera evergladensis SR1]|uniref:Uncharacterized protein n=1 Tax=Candidatus Nitrososphaera evergladensis SR1 TaxID=1459636 RepID=A0A075MTE9_9ARCH|nr:hypothetical protein [Candidatus Nitrososphaera evergladensis]AIF82579.1 hypothetical protein NTE_00498 [Candidatus Nitrososphaera evergladensis SR1]